MTPAPFQPARLLGNPHLQTLLGAIARPRREPPSRTRLVQLPDGDRLALEVTTPTGWGRRDPTAVLVHGLTGSHRSAYMVRLAAKLSARGWRAVRLNLRGSGSGEGLARRPYHAGCSDDVGVVLRALAAEEPDSPQVLAGFSLGGNMALKLAAELGDEGPGLLRGALAVCPAADLVACSARLTRAAGGLYDRYFVAYLRWAIARRNELFPDEPHALPRARSMVGFDDAYTAPQWGFADAADYYARASAKPLLGGIRVPCRVALAADDPIVDPAMLDDVALPPQVQVTRVAGGGHLGFLGRRGPEGRQWLDALVLAWCAERVAVAGAGGARAVPAAPPRPAQALGSR